MTLHVTGYRFVILGILLIATLSWGLVLFGVPVTLNQIIPELGISNAEAGAVFGSLYLSLVLGGVVSGFLSDRMGLKRFMLAGMLLGGISGILRGFSHGIIDLLIYSLIFSFSTVIITSGSAGVIRLWFRSRELGTASGLWNAFFGLGALTAMIMTQSHVIPLVGSWRGAFTLYASVMLLAAILWATLYREPSREVETGSYPTRYKSVKLLRSLNMWLVLIAFLFIVGNQNAVINWMPILLEVRGLTPGHAGLLSSIVWVGALSGSVVVPTVSDRIGRRILPVTILTPVMGLTIYGLTLLDVGSSILPLVIFGLGFTSSYAWAMFLTIIMELPDVGRDNVSRASGFLLSASGVGAFFLPVLGGFMRDLTGSLTQAFITYAISAQVAVIALTALALRMSVGGYGRKI
ncbi:MAG: MFS transporter [Nitrososphaerota archaeon]